MFGNFNSLNHPCALQALEFDAPPRILVLAPHPDDFDAIGVTLKYFFNLGSELSIFVALTGSGVEEGYLPGASLAEITEFRKQEQIRSMNFFGLPEGAAVFQTLENDNIDQMTETPANYEIICKQIEQAAPDVVFLPHRNDSNDAHRAMYSMFSRAVAEIGRPVAALLCRDPKTLDMRTDVYTSFGEDTAAWKGEMLRCHDSQHQRNLNSRGYGFDDRILQTNRQIAQDLNLTQPYAEAFEVEPH